MNRKSFGLQLLMFSPGFIAFLLFMMVPIVLCLYYSFTDWNGLDRSYRLVAFANYIDVFRDREFARALGITLFFTVTLTIATNVCGLLFALLLNKSGKLTNLYRSVFLFPLLVSTVAVGFIWKSLLSYNGIVGNVLERYDLERIQFLGLPTNALLTVTFIAIWQSTGLVIVLYLAGLQHIPRELYDASSIDGANRWTKFRHVTFPLLAPSLTMAVVFNFTGAFREYDRVAVLTSGGPARATETLAYHIVRVGFRENRLGHASGEAICMLLVAGLLSVALTVYLRKREERML